jgi:hypothetical protein
MSGRNALGLILSAVLLLLVGGSGMARGPGPSGPLEAAGASASPYAGAPWLNMEIDTAGDTGRHVSVALDEQRGRVYVSYYNATDGDLYLAQNWHPGGNCGPGNNWFCTVVDSPGDVGKYNSVAVNPQTGGVGIAYHDASNGMLKYAYFANPDQASFTTHVIDKGIVGVSTTGLHTALKYRDTGKPFIAYQFYNPTNVEALMLAYYSVTNGNCGHDGVEGEWQCETIITGEGVGQYNSMAIDGDGEQHVSYYDGGRGELWYATSGQDINCGHYGANWYCYGVSGGTADVGRYSSIYVDDDNDFHIAYYDATHEQLMYAEDVGSGGDCGILNSAQCDDIDPMPADYHPLGVSIAEDGSGYPIIAYQAENGSLKAARPVAAVGLPVGGGNCGPEEDLLFNWSCATIDRHGTYTTYRNGDFVSMAVNSSGLGTIAYSGFIINDAGNLMVSRQVPDRVFLPLVARNP